MSSNETATAFKTLQLQRNGDGTVWLTLDVPGARVNTLSAAVFAELNHALTEIGADAAATGLIILSGKADGFIAGADIGELALMDQAQAFLASRSAQAVLDRLAALPIPTVAAIHGACLGGGLELALACDARIVTDVPQTQLGLPEVQLGLIPGAGGTQRLPRLIGLAAALDLILTGKSVRAAKAVKLGLAAAAVPPSLLREQAAALLGLLHADEEPETAKTLKQRLLDSALGRPQVVNAAQKVLLTKGGHYPAPFKALTAAAQGLDGSLSEGLAVEAQLFSELVGTAVNRSLIHVFQATTAAKGGSGKTEGQQVEQLGVIGGGLMGSGIAIAAAAAGIPVRVRDVDTGAVGRTLQASAQYFDGLVAKKRLRPFERDQHVGRISGTIDQTGMRHADVLIEAVYEDLGLKRQILAEWEAIARPDAVFASNTSSLSITAIAAEAEHPERVIGMHFFSPVPKMPLVEVIVHPGTSDETTATTVSLARRMGKHVIVVGDGVGFYTSRDIGAYLNEAMHLLADGATVETMDRAMAAFGFPVGPCTLMDEVGLDVGQKVTRILHEAFGDRFAPPDGFEGLATPARRGRKSGRGFYVYDDPTRPVDGSIYALFGETPAATLSEMAIQRRLVLAFCNEAAWALSDGILRSSADGDLGAIYGLGFPPFLGGPFWYLDSLGLSRAVDELQGLASSVGSRFTPAPVLLELVAIGGRFYPEV
ncbi:MAG: enoyl-CoA hydratase/isomerase family protein [Candidatus Sericytochromatia bacterium]|nr:enoyl-CoA hydratase/isomerase family protein [Candidatus Sericytochromatia bacterium]